MRSLFGLNSISSYTIVENSVIVKEFKELCRKEQKLGYVENLKDLRTDFLSDFFYLSGTLQYGQNPYRLLDDLLFLQPQFFCLNRTPVWNRASTLTKQISTRVGDIGERLTYPCWVFNEEQLNSSFESKGYKKFTLQAGFDKPYITRYGFLPYSCVLYSKH